MKKNFHLDDFETYLSDSADRQRMYPSDRVWRNIDKELHGQKKWPALTFGALLTGAIITAGLILVHPDKNLLHVNPENAGSVKEQPTVPFNQKDKIVSLPANGNENLVKIASNNRPTIASNQAHYSEFSEKTSGQGAIAANSEITSGLMTSNESGQLMGWEPEKVISGRIGLAKNVFSPNAGLAIEPALQVNDDELASLANGIILRKRLADNDIVSQFEIAEPTPLSVDKKKRSLGIEYYFSPSYSYRYLTETKIVDLHQNQQSGPIAPNLLNPVNNFVSHKPTLGLEAGAGIVYEATDKLQFKAGLQLNMRGYSIDAFAAGLEPSTIVLNRGYSTDSIFALSSYNSQSGYKEVSLMNRYWQIAMPVGLQYQVTSGKKLNLSIAASIQPTYQFNSSEYILSHDYKNYLQQPDLVRHWNINTAIGAVISYEVGKLNWQVGPQIRYQAMSGTVSEYPIKEHLIDYGLRIGVVKTLK